MRTVAPWHQPQELLGTLFTAVVLFIMLLVLVVAAPFVFGGHILANRSDRRSSQPVQQEKDVSTEWDDRQGESS